MRIKNKYIIFFVLGIVLFLSACAPEEDDIDVDPRLKFTGTWIANENSSVFGASAYQVTANTDPNVGDRINISNFYNLGAGTSVFAAVTGNSIIIPNQQTAQQTIDGSGSFANNSFNATFTANDGQNADNVNVQFSKP